MRRRSAIGAAVLLAAGLASSARAAPPAPAPDSEEPPEGVLAPMDCWTVQDGSLGRTGAAATAPVEGALGVGWTWTAKGTIEGEPRVWKDRVFVCDRLTDKRCALRLLRLSDGKESYAETIDGADAPLEPAVWGDVVVVRSARNRLDGYSIGERMFTRRWRRQGKDFGPPLLVRQEVYVRDSTSLQRLTYEKAEPVWEFPVRPVDGYALRGPEIFATIEDVARNVELVAVARADGRLVAGLSVGNAMTKPSAEAVSVRAATDYVAVEHGTRILMDEGPEVDTVIVTLRHFRGDREEQTKALVALPFRNAPVPTPAGWVGAVDFQEGGRQLVRKAGVKRHGKLDLRFLADAKTNAEFIPVVGRFTVAGGVVHLGASTFSPQTHEVLRRDDRPFLRRSIPAKDCLLVVAPDGKTLTALRAARGPDPRGPWRYPIPAAGLPADAAVALEKGPVRRGAWIADVAAGILTLATPPKGATPVALADVLAVATADGALVAAPDAQRGATGLVAAARAFEATAWLALVDEALAASDADGARRWAAAARRRGTPEAELLPREKKAAAVAAARKPVDAAVAEGIEARASALLARGDADAVWAALGKLPETSPLHQRSGLVRETLARNPSHAEAVAWIRRALPEGTLPPTARFDALEWLDVADAAAEVGLRRIDLPAGRGEKGLDARQRELGSLRHTWRPDIEWLETKSLVLLTPLAKPGRIARTLSAGELACSTLEGIFAAVPARRTSFDPLLHHLYESEAEYVEQATKWLSGENKAQEQKRKTTFAKQYVPGDRLTRLYMPSLKVEFQEALPDYVQQLTLHWLEMRCPLYAPGEAKGLAGNRPGLWVERGLSTMVNEFRFDVEQRTVTTLNPRAWSLDVVASAAPSDLLPWETVLAAGVDEFNALSDKADVMIPLRWEMGVEFQLSPRSLFVAQAAAFCHWALHADKGAKKAALVRAVADHYTDDSGPDLVQTRFGLDRAAAGAAVQAWAREVSRPK